MLIDTAVVERLRNTPGWRQIEAEDEAQREAARATATRALAAATAERDRAVPRIAAKTPAAQEALVKARAALHRAQMAHGVLVQERATVLNSYRAAEQQAARVFAATAPTEILELRQVLSAALQTARGNFNVVDVVPVTKMGAADPKPVMTQSNTTTVTAFLTAALAGIRRCDALVSAPLTRAAIRTELTQIRASMPQMATTGFQFELDVVGRPTMFERVGGR